MNNALTHAILTAIFFTMHLSNAAAQEAAPEADPWRALQQVSRAVPTAGLAAAHVFLVDQEVVVQLPGDLPQATAYRVTDEQLQPVAEGHLDTPLPASVTLGSLGVGWYRVSFLDAADQEVGWTTAAVLARLRAATPQDSPICVDSATAWFARSDRAQQERFSHLAALAGVNWVRDRLRWREVQPDRNGLVTDVTTYDSAAEIQQHQGLKVLQVFHDTPPWAAAEPGKTGRFPGDLRIVYEFGKLLSARFHGTVQAWEPWNEANIPTFGGHTIDEICSFQKAAYLGFKAGDPQVTVCWNVITGIPTSDQTAGVLRNETWPYFDTYNIHTYDWSHGYEAWWEPVREAASGKPLWVTESDRGMEFDPASAHRDLTLDNERKKAQYVTQSYATSLSAGTHRHFHFILGDYVEGKTQFGLLRHDLTPRIGYVALAALGRLLAGARCLGRCEVDDPNVHVYAFRARPDGQSRDVLVAWAETTAEWLERGTHRAPWSPPTDLSDAVCYDYLGRPVDPQPVTELTSAPLFLVLPAGRCDALSLHRASQFPLRPGTPSPIVLQCLLPVRLSQSVERVRWAGEVEHVLPCEEQIPLPIYAYNFAPHAVRGRVSVDECPEGIALSATTWDIDIPPPERVLLPTDVTVTRPGDSPWLTLRGDFGADGTAVLALRFRGRTDGPSEP